MDTFLQLPVKRPFQVKLFFILWAACILAVIAVLPFSLATQAATLDAFKEQLTIPFWLLLVIQVGQSAVLFAIAAGAGLWLATRTGLGLPFVEGWLDGKPIWERLPRVAGLAAIIGVVGSLIVIALDVEVFAPAMETLLEGTPLAEQPEVLQPAWWKGLLASFYGGISEEVLLRLFMLTLLAWLGHFISQTEEGRPTVVVLWVANLLAAVLFGLGHLPATAQAGIPITPMIITRAVALNGVLALAFGWLYWTRGLESAIIAHFSADIVLHVILPLVTPFFVP